MDGLLSCRTGITIHGAIGRSVITDLTTVCPIITRTIIASTSMSASAGIGRVTIAIAAITGMAVIRITGMAPM